MVSIGVGQLSLWQSVHFWSPSRDRSACANAESEAKSTETLAQIRKSRIILRIFFLRVQNLVGLKTGHNYCVALQSSLAPEDLALNLPDIQPKSSQHNRDGNEAHSES